MHFSGVNLPNELVKAAQEGNLVVFAGAGVSRGDPTKLPSFDDLVVQIKSIVDPCDTLPKCKENESPIRYLGKLERKFGGVHNACSEAIGIENECSEIHKDLVGLFGKTNLKIVTTNFDLCFEDAMIKEGYTNKVYSAPALPLGNRFNGLIHLHGNVREPQDQVLTDVDFGSAYVTSQWASKFLVDTFNSNTILFVGYSCTDDLVDYLTRSVSASSSFRAYALISENEDSDHWLDRGVISICFNEYDNLPKLVHEWRKYVASALFNRVSMLKRIASGKPDNLARNDGDFLYACLDLTHKDSKSHRSTFCNEARDSEWLMWLYQKNLLNSLFDDNELDQFAFWAAESFACTDFIMFKYFYENSGQSYSIGFIVSVLDALIEHKADENEVASWLLLIEDNLSRIRHFNRDLLSLKLIQLLQISEKEEISLHLIKILYQARGYESPFCLLSGDQRNEVILQAIDDLNLESKVFGFVIEELEKHASISTILGSNSGQYTFYTSILPPLGVPIETDSVTLKKGSLVSILNLAVFCGVRLVENDEKSAINAVMRCLESNLEVIKRVGLFLLEKTSLPSETKIQSIVNYDVLKDLKRKFEFSELIRSNLKHCSNKVQNELVEYMKERLLDKDDEEASLHDYYDLLCSIHSLQIEVELVESDIQQIRTVHPEWQARQELIEPIKCEAFWVNTDSCKIDPNAFSYEYCRQAVTDPPIRELGIDANDIIGVPAKQYPDLVCSIIQRCIDNGLDNIDKKILESFSWEARWGDVIKADKESFFRVFPVLTEDALIMRGVLFGVHSMLNDELALKVVDSKDLEFIVDEIEKEWICVENLELAFESNDGVNWVEQAINHPVGWYVDFLRATISLISEEKGIETKELFLKKKKDFLFNVIARKGRASSLAEAAFFLHFNEWFNISPNFVEFIIAASVNQDKLLGEAALDGLSYNSFLNSESWNILFPLLEKKYEANSKRLSSVEDGLARLFVWCLIMLTDDPETRKRLFVLCALSSDDAKSASLSYLEDWLDYIDSSERIDAWKTWIERVLIEIASYLEDHLILISHVYRWLGKFSSINDELLEFATSNLRPTQSDVLFSDVDFPDILRRSNLEDNLKTKALLLFIKCNFWLFDEKVDASLEYIDFSYVDAELIVELKDELIRHNIRGENTEKLMKR